MKEEDLQRFAAEKALADWKEEVLIMPPVVRLTSDLYQQIYVRAYLQAVWDAGRGIKAIDGAKKILGEE